MNITGALSDSNRVRALLALRGGELCVCQLIELLGLAPSTVSKHLSILRNADLIEDRKEGRWVYYRLAGAGNGTGNGSAKKPPTVVKDALRWVQASLVDDEQTKADAKRLKQILKEDPEEL